MVDYPDDADVDVLRGLAAKGVDLGQPRAIEFCCYASDEAVANRIATRLSAAGFKCDIYEAEDATDIAKRFSVYSSVTMVPTYERVTRTQSELNEILKSFGTHCDGWGTLVEPTELKSTSL